ncbi:UDP-N-acetylglucosamine 1-carboxyvinyltransferase [Streptomyces sp. SRF1]|uniref:UDP-N-acetylglucosamine 1-carboxyvinyltransferase n=1 Tax=Streptomyces sp. SRF1 TaxID=1549642 RepID=UPI0025B00D70|nr:UDP-N-acetylglucosamine 1-carboxyvinyltransferase [Streptomyces sp. SRF1]MDN3056900.1 UDP-N-acetylglucosamine 1-carboxyvinyltransferase [Streptomyces sp. SRF1]
MTQTSAPPAVTDDMVVRVTGGRPLSGRIIVQGSKNIALHLYAAALLADAPVTLLGAPAILDTDVCAQILTHTGAHVTVAGDQFTVTPAAQVRPVIHPQLGRRVRTTCVLAAAVLARCGRVSFPQPGGDAFCARLIDRHLAAMEAAGAVVSSDETGVFAQCGPDGVRPFTVDVSTPYGPSLGATVTAMLLAARARGTSLITTPSIEPEVTETAAFLAERGVGVHWDEAGLHVTGAAHVAGGTFVVAGDRIEAATMIMAAAVTGGTIRLGGITTAGLPGGLTAALANAGVQLVDAPGGEVHMALTGPLRAVETATGPHPGLPTDTAPQLAAMLTQAHGTSQITERVYPQRDTHLQGLTAFGAAVSSRGPAVLVHGASRLRAAQVGASDIRAVTSLLMAGLVAEGTSTIRGMYHLRRGYGHLLSHLSALGADITTIPEARPCP